MGSKPPNDRSGMVRVGHLTHPPFEALFSGQVKQRTPRIEQSKLLFYAASLSRCIANHIIRGFNCKPESLLVGLDCGSAREKESHRQ
jgi:hypothetical protein